ncbi:MAG: HAD family hydrolase, partial [Acidobacteriota bacterium]|nr:HAD family hydrolase [Acidobacteriota bacterium]
MSESYPRGTIRAVFFDVDFTLIYPGPAFQASGYREFCGRFGIDVDPAAFDMAVSSAASLLEPDGGLYDAQLYVDYTRRIIEGMGGRGAQVAAAAQAIYTEWAACHHFLLYEDVPEVLRALHASGLKMGLITNSHRCLASFQTHFALEGLFSVTVSSLDHGYMKPHP